ncbi:YbhB/YbcL family Raf kinase inhibitor-like protein [Helicobacter suis]|uniref:YbhB/YbcL family Raf kinase inhibitor-like protein n=1 Tax=Helicobacter suis TaxID=104628 RepID=UPI0013D6ADF4|nr:YbhB/YbcL family Raf kinase inhibitor-like protein [Helicobacter suis]
MLGAVANCDQIHLKQQQHQHKGKHMQFFKVFIHTDTHGFLDSKFGGNADASFLDNHGIPRRSPEISWESVAGAKSYALELVDYDAATSGGKGKPFIHWVVGNITETKLAENASVEDKHIDQGINSLTEGYTVSSLSAEEKQASNLANSNYIGPMPPDKDHHYLIQVYALDVAHLDLKKPFFIGQLHDAMRGHIIGLGRVEFKYAKLRR